MNDLSSLRLLVPVGPADLVPGRGGRSAEWRPGPDRTGTSLGRERGEGVSIQADNRGQTETGGRPHHTQVAVQVDGQVQGAWSARCYAELRRACPLRPVETTGAAAAAGSERPRGVPQAGKYYGYLVRAAFY